MPSDWSAGQVVDKLYARHPGSGGQMPGPWTVIEEWRRIDLLAFSAWASVGNYGRVGYEVKVSRSDLRSELLNPAKRAENVAWCNEFYFAFPRGLLTAEELAWEEPEWAQDDWLGERCSGLFGQKCHRRWGRRGKTYFVEVARPATDRGTWRWTENILCPTCGGKGYVTESRVVREAPTCWVPRDVGLVLVDGRGSAVVRRSPRRAEVPRLSPGELNQLVRWVSIRPDPRHGRRVINDVSLQTA